MILTLALPVMDGLEFLQNYRTSGKQGRQIAPVLALSPISAYLYQAIDLGAQCGLQIPVDRGLLLDSVQSLLSGKSAPEHPSRTLIGGAGGVSEKRDTSIRTIESRVLDQLLRIFEMDSLSLATVQSGELHFQMGAGARVEQWAREPALLGSSPCQLVLSSGHWLGIGDLASNPLFRTSQWTRVMGLRSYLGAPVVSHEGQILGVLAAHGDRPRISLHSEKRLLQLFSQRISSNRGHPRASQEWVAQILPSLQAISIHRGLKLSVALLEGVDLRLMAQLEERVSGLPWQVFAGADPMTNSWLLVGWNIDPQVLRGWTVEIASGMSAYSIRVEALSRYGSDLSDIWRDLYGQSIRSSRDTDIAV
ncbi:GAF domain-containing protein [bacterium]|nr:GAF domain-containing protein [bacterium]